MRISDWSSDVLFRSDLHAIWGGIDLGAAVRTHDLGRRHGRQAEGCRGKEDFDEAELEGHGSLPAVLNGQIRMEKRPRSEEHTSELQSLMRISYAVFCLKKKKIVRHAT